MNIIDLGICEYKKAEMIQKAIHSWRVAGKIPDTLIFTIHPPVFTLGKNGNPENLLLPLDKLKEKGFAFYHTERGGDITYHGYGQLLLYPIFFLPKGLGGIKRFIQKWEEVIIYSLASFGIVANIKAGSVGVYVGEAKIASFGFALKDRTTYHGIALNVKDDLTPFSFIHPCGQKGQKMTAIENILRRNVEMSEVKEAIIKNLSCLRRTAPSRIEAE